MSVQHSDGVIFSDHCYNMEGDIIEEIPTGVCSYIYLVVDIRYSRFLPEEEQLDVIPFVTRTLRITGLGECFLGPLHPED